MPLRQVAEVLGGVADGLLPLQEAGAEEVLGDALRLLGSKEIKVGRPAGDRQLSACLVVGSQGSGPAAPQRGESGLVLVRPCVWTISERKTKRKVVMLAVQGR